MSVATKPPPKIGEQVDVEVSKGRCTSIHSGFVQRWDDSQICLVQEEGKGVEETQSVLICATTLVNWEYNQTKASPEAA